VKGNLIVPGFTDHITNKVAEWNLYVDPTAAAIVVESGLPITLVPLDATNSLQVTMGLLKTLRDNHGTPSANFVYEELLKNKGFINSGEFYLWDPTAAVVGANLEDPVGTVEQLKIKVETTPGDEEGRTYEADDGDVVNVYTSADPKKTFNEYLEVLTGKKGLYDVMRKFNEEDSHGASSEE
jgi:inosine-uridine nucleoside N-ribohydrolase